jgi:hypothetical protein
MAVEHLRLHGVGEVSLFDAVHPPGSGTTLRYAERVSSQDINQLLEGVLDFEVCVDDRSVVVRRSSSDGWLVYLDEKLIGLFIRRRQDRATYFESEVASEPGTTDWVSDDVTVLISRMITLE